MSTAEIDRILTVWLERLRLDRWDICIRWELDVEADKDTGAKPEAEIRIHPDYDQASIRLNQEKVAGWDARFVNATLVHELLHVFEHGTKRAAESLVGNITGSTYDVFFEWYSHEAERWVDALAFVLVDAAGCA